MKLTLARIVAARLEFRKLRPMILGFKSHLFTGSAIADVRNAKDVNVVVHVACMRSTANDLLRHAGFDVEEHSLSSSHISLRRGDLNIILTESLNDFIRWNIATDTMLSLGARLRTKADRVTLFGCILRAGL